METADFLKQCTVEPGNVVKLPGVQLDRKAYLEVKKALELIGGKWKGGRTCGFEFPHDPTEMLAQISNGEKRNLKKEHQAFYTPPELAERLVKEACVYTDSTILEPSAGSGRMIEAVLKLHNEFAGIFYCENMPTALILLNQKFAAHPRVFKLDAPEDDFLKLRAFPDSTPAPGFDRIIANPPFSRNQDIDHIYKMYALLAPGGRMVTLASLHWRSSDNMREGLFRKWLRTTQAVITDLPRGTSSESGTEIALCMIRIDAPTHPRRRRVGHFPGQYARYIS